MSLKAKETDGFLRRSVTCVFLPLEKYLEESEKETTWEAFCAKFIGA